MVEQNPIYFRGNPEIDDGNGNSKEKDWISVTEKRVLL